METKVLRKIVKIDEELCTGCMACIEVCPFEAIQLNPDYTEAKDNLKIIEDSFR